MTLLEAETGVSDIKIYQIYHVRGRRGLEPPQLAPGERQGGPEQVSGPSRGYRRLTLNVHPNSIVIREG